MTDRAGERLPGRAPSIVDDASLESALADLASVLDIPATPDFATAVRVRLNQGGAPAPRSRAAAPWPDLRLRPALLFAMLALAVLVVAGVAAAIGFGLPGLQIIFSGATPPPAVASPLATTPAMGSPAPTSQVPLDLGTPTTLDQAQTSVAFRVFVPDLDTVGGTEPAVYLDSRVIDGEVVLAYPAGNGLPAPPGGPVDLAGQPIGLLVTESRGSVDQGILGKVLGPGTTLERVDINGEAGFWISGRPHRLLIYDASGQPQPVTLREVGDVLVWVGGGTLLRIESRLGLAGTLRVAQSMR